MYFLIFFESIVFIFLFALKKAQVYISACKPVCHLFSSCKDVKNVEGNWSAIVASKDIKTTEDSKELVLDVKFNANVIEGTWALCCFVFNFESRMVVTVLKIKWISQAEIVSQSQCRFETLWISYEPLEQQFNNSFNVSLGSDQGWVMSFNVFEKGLSQLH